MACKTAVKAGERLPREKMEFLVRELFRTSNPAVCPHGRPIVVRLDRAVFERRAFWDARYNAVVN